MWEGKTEWLDAEKENGIEIVELVKDVARARLSTSPYHFMSMRAFVVTGVRLVRYTSVYRRRAEGSQLSNSARYASLEAVEGLTTAHLWHPMELERFAAMYGVEAFYPAHIFVPPRQWFWWQLGVYGQGGELGLTLAFSWERASVEPVDGQWPHDEAANALERRVELPTEKLPPSGALA